MSLENVMLSQHEFDWSCWSVKLPKSNRVQDTAANVTLNSDKVASIAEQVLFLT